MNSPKFLNYETRPVKFTERKMLLSSLLKICNKNGGEYQYVGFGGLTFTDFKIFHKKLHIKEMHSIEGGDFSVEKLKYNSPYSFIEIHKNFSTNVLTQIDLTRKTLIWLDYDGALDTYMFDDLSILMNRLPEGSVYIFTCNRELKSQEGEGHYTVSEFERKFTSLTPFGIKNKDFGGQENFKTIRKMLLQQIEDIMSSRKRLGHNVKFTQLYNILYEENRGARMYTFGGIITKEESEIESLELSSLDFIKYYEDPYRLNIPNLTHKEEILISEYLGDEKRIEVLKAKNIVSDTEIRKYIETYKYLPSFFDVPI